MLFSKKTLHANYHWVIAVVVFLQMIVFGGIINSYSIYLIPITEDLGISRGLYSASLVAQTVAVMFSTTATTYLFRRFGYRKVVCSSLIVLGASMLLSAVCKEAYLYIFSKILFGIGYGACHTAGAAWIVKAWFHKHHGTVLGVVTMGTGVGGSLFSVFLTDVMEKLDWRWAHIVSAGLLVAVMLLMLVFLRDQPELIGLKPYGDDLEHAKAHRHKRKEKTWPGISAAQTRRHPAFWMMAGCVLVVCICVTGGSAVLVPHLQDKGYTAMEAAQFQSVYMFALAVTKLLCGWVSERIGGKALGAICVASAAAGLWLLTDLSSPAVTYITVIIFSVALTMTSVTVPLLCESVFGTETSAGVLGTILGISSLGSVFSSPITNICHDATGSYDPVFRISVAVTLAMLVVLFVIFWMFGKIEKKYRKSAA